MHNVLGVFVTVANQFILQLDQILPTEDKGLQKVYKALNKFGDKVRKATESPEKFDALKLTGGLKALIKAIAAAIPEET